MLGHKTAAAALDCRMRYERVHLATATCCQNRMPWGYCGLGFPICILLSAMYVCMGLWLQEFKPLLGWYRDVLVLQRMGILILLSQW